MGILFRFCGCLLAMPLAAELLPGVHTAAAETAWIAGGALGLLYLFVRPIARLLISPLNCLSIGVLGFVIDTLFVQLAAGWLTGFKIDSFGWALLTALLTSILREVMGKLAEKRP
ncbi:MAG: phage holin family protein [Clostridia bacterium]|nr:phage holin family protein [Clostridia bacterium]